MAQHSTPDEQNRQDLITWLVRNDPNGCYTDEQCDSEDQPRLTLEETIATRTTMLALTTER